LIIPDSPLAHALRPSPNFGERRGTARPNLLLLHYTGVASAAQALDWLTRRESKVSCHYLIDEEGKITQLVAENMRAWHAGEAAWAGETDINSVSIGIEVHNPGHEFGYPDFADVQMRAVEALASDIVARCAIPRERVLAHSDVAPMRKKDPGEKFPWARLGAAGIGHWREPAPVRAGDVGLGRGSTGVTVAHVQRLLRDYGYGIEATGVLDLKTEFVISAFQRHFRPERVDGRIDDSTISTLERLLAALPSRSAIS
jgi:N-acetylmuramoyl-L-alanine amidase